MILLKILYRSSFNTLVTNYTDSTSKRRKCQQAKKIEQHGKNNESKTISRLKNEK
jgi:hypothetical protein